MGNRLKMSLPLDLDNKWSYLKTHGSDAWVVGMAGTALEEYGTVLKPWSRGAARAEVYSGDRPCPPAQSRVARVMSTPPPEAACLTPPVAPVPPLSDSQLTQRGLVFEQPLG